MLAREGIRASRKRVGQVMLQMGIQDAHLHNIGNHPTGRDAASAPDLVDTSRSEAEHAEGGRPPYVKTLQGSWASVEGLRHRIGPARPVRQVRLPPHLAGQPSGSLS
jgi:hypothetical protein